MGAFLGLLFGLGCVAVYRARTVAATPKKAGESWQDRTRELLLQAGIEGVSFGQLLGASVTAARTIKLREAWALTHRGCVGAELSTPPWQGCLRSPSLAPMSGVDAVELEVRELVRRRGIDPFLDRAAVRRLVDEVVADYDERSLSSMLATLPDPKVAARAVYDAVAGFGPLQRHFDDKEVEEIWINGRLTGG